MPKPHRSMRVRTIVPEANEWVPPSVMTIHGRGATARQWEREQLRSDTTVELLIGTLCLLVNSPGEGTTRREWQSLAIIDEQGTCVDIERSGKTSREFLAAT